MIRIRLEGVPAETNENSEPNLINAKLKEILTRNQSCEKICKEDKRYVLLVRISLQNITVPLDCCNCLIRFAMCYMLVL